MAAMGAGKMLLPVKIGVPQTLPTQLAAASRPSAVQSNPFSMAIPILYTNFFRLNSVAAPTAITKHTATAIPADTP